MKFLKDGESRTIKASRKYSMFKHDSFKIEALCIDSDTPCVVVDIKYDHHSQGWGLPSTAGLVLTDVQAMDLIDRLQQALDILPSSK